MTHRTTETLRESLFQAIEDVRTGAIDRFQAREIGNLADKIVKSAEIELRYALTLSNLDRQDQGISPGPLLLTKSKEVLI